MIGLDYVLVNVLIIIIIHILGLTVDSERRKFHVLDFFSLLCKYQTDIKCGFLYWVRV